MDAWMVVTEARYVGVTNAQGAVIMQEVPSGTYTLSVWHEQLGETRQSVVIGQQPTTVTVHLLNQRRSG